MMKILDSLSDTDFMLYRFKGTYNFYHWKLHLGNFRAHHAGQKIVLDFTGVLAHDIDFMSHYDKLIFKARLDREKYGYEIIVTGIPKDRVENDSNVCSLAWVLELRNDRKIIYKD